MVKHSVGDLVWFQGRQYQVIDAWNPPREDERGWVKLEEVEGSRSESVLAHRIKAGKADPISEEEREIAASLRDFFEGRSGKH